jgi:hypothetical protein
MAAQTTGLGSFTSALQYGGARPSLFEFKISAPPTGVNATLSDVHLYCNVTEIPPLTLTPIERQYFGRTVKIPGDLVFADLSTTIINTENYNVRNEIEKWMEQINGTISNESKTAANFGTGTAQLVHYQKDGAATMTYQFEEIWPTAVSEIALSYDTASDIEQFDVTWAYNYYTMSGGAVTTGNPTQT